MTNRKSFFILCVLTLSGCAGYNETFDCESGIGVGCKSLSHVNRMVDRGELPLTTEDSGLAAADLEPAAAKIPHVSSGKHLHMWIAGVQDGSSLSMPINLNPQESSC